MLLYIFPQLRRAAEYARDLVNLKRPGKVAHDISGTPRGNAGSHPTCCMEFRCQADSWEPGCVVGVCLRRALFACAAVLMYAFCLTRGPPTTGPPGTTC